MWGNHFKKNYWRYLKKPPSNSTLQPSESTIENLIFSRILPLKPGLTSPTSFRLHFVSNDLVVSASVKNFPLYMTCHIIVTSFSPAMIVALLTSASIWNLLVGPNSRSWPFFVNWCFLCFIRYVDDDAEIRKWYLGGCSHLISWPFYFFLSKKLHSNTLESLENLKIPQLIIFLITINFKVFYKMSSSATVHFKWIYRIHV